MYNSDTLLPFYPVVQLFLKIYNSSLSDDDILFFRIIRQGVSHSSSLVNAMCVSV